MMDQVLVVDTFMTPATHLTQSIWLTGFALVSFAGGPVVGYPMGTLDTPQGADGLPKAGYIIDVLERIFIFVFVLPNNITAVGFLVAAKSVMRFETTQKDRHWAEYVIVSTLAAFAWALLCALATRSLLAQTGMTP